jgi:hypothetical protein
MDKKGELCQKKAKISLAPIILIITFTRTTQIHQYCLGEVCDRGMKNAVSQTNTQLNRLTELY